MTLSVARAWNVLASFSVTREVLPSVSYSAGLVGLGMAGGASDSDGKVAIPFAGWSVQQSWLAWASAVALVLGLVLLGLRSTRLKGVERERDSAVDRAESAEAMARTARTAARRLSEIELHLMAEELRHFSSERTSLMIKTADGFVLAARWSANPTFNSQTRHAYPEGQGCLWRAWEKGQEVCTDLPDPRVNLETWVESQARWAIPADVATSMTMKSRTYAAFRIDSSSRGEGALGVIVFESEQVAGEDRDARLTLGQLQTAVKGKQGQRLRGLLEQLRQIGD